MPTKIDVFVDCVCPFCFRVEPAIEELKRDRDVEVTIRPFELRPDSMPTLRPEDEYLPRVWTQSVHPMSIEHGINPFTLHHQLHLPGQASAHPGAVSKGTPS